MLKAITNTLLSPLQLIIRDSRSLGIILMLCAIVSLLVSNSGWSDMYLSAWLHEFHFPEPLHLPHSVLHWVNDGLMAIFFFMVGMEIKRELLDGELADMRKALLPVFAAIGGMVVPALLFNGFNKGTEYAHGWGIPMATDIAFSLGIASILGKRVPVALKVFLTALAIIDDLGAIGVIALFYGGQIQWMMLGGALVTSFAIYLLAKRKGTFYLRLFLAVFLWYLIFNSGIHATVAGVLFAFTIPMRELSHIEHKLHIPVNFVILPVFALANTAIILPSGVMDALDNTLNFGIMAGLVIGKPLGIMIFSYLLVQLKWGALPENVSWMQMLGVGMLAGIGFTMSIFIATLAFTDAASQDIAKISVLLASLLSVILGSLTLIFFSKTLTPEP
ncbi:MAG TPA: Na+/H+ antiporter NhaA [Chitinophagaceae bacterium]|nr:Na+/H+ antiporter NhaA [Chitinophagaceae bacterium]